MMAASRHRTQLSGLDRREGAAKQKLATELKRIADFIAAGACPACGTKTTAPSVKAHAAEQRKLANDEYHETLESLQAERSDLESAIAASEATQDAAQAESEAATERAATAKARGEAIKAEVDTESSEWYKQREHLRVSIQSAEHALVVANAARRRYDQIHQKLKTLKDRRGLLEARGREIMSESDELAQDLAHMEFWVKGFSNAGLSSYMMDSVMPALTERANHYLSILADGDITVSFDTQSKLKSGDTREKLSISWVIEGENDTTPSGGQRKKISIAVDLALMDLVATRERAAVDLLLMDEMLDGLDATGRSRVMSLLGELRQKRSTIVVISHDNTIAELFENTMTVRKMDRKAELLVDVT